MYFGEFEKDCLEAHNQYRARHHSPPLILDIGLCKYAHEWAQHLASRNTLQHRSNNNYGENIFMSMGRTNISGRDAVRSWYDEVQDYNFHGGGFSQGTGHFTQVVWRDSKRLGVGMAKRGNSIYVVANYDPPGNFRGEYAKNVLPAVC
ncbi:Golgi-associated plant pathogenesis-related protein 1-like [Rhagoletis pomonella]|uniref:Golgi-associated plant pathogenesis-related protein 1-like n=1 Tax=Rhagoletis pomonella TaxID=28610 RepID=UPI001780D9EE|nr:Golgi-associated plant pathogenesis-related protein 1-like [Rhagoletis pomonella]